MIPLQWAMFKTAGATRTEWGRMIEVEHLSKVYGATTAVEDVTFSVEPGEILGFLGPNGAGKTTTMRILSGYLPATAGTAKVAGFEVHDDSMAVRQRIGYLPETPPLYPDMSVEAFLHFVARIKGVSAGDRPKQVELALEKTNLGDRRKSLIRKLSKGYRQRVGIAQAIVHDPPVIILDEPTVGLDPRQIIEVRNLIRNLAGNHTVILSTHILPEVSMVCSRVTIINKGRVVATNSPDSLMAQLTSGGGYELELAADLAQLEPTLRAIAGVKTLEPITAALPAGHHKLRILGDPSTPLPGDEIAAAVLACGGKLYELRRVQASLEDVFLQLTMEEQAAEELSESEAEAEAEAEAGDLAVDREESADK
jgi:ABC-2 type transport system ATP-binding protein